MSEQQSNETVGSTIPRKYTVKTKIGGSYATSIGDGLLNVFVRLPQTPPPIANPLLFGCLSMNLIWNAFHLVFSHVYSFHNRPFLLAFGGYIIACELGLIVDAFSSNNFGYSIIQLRKAGYTDWIILAYMQFNLVISQLFGYTVTSLLVSDPQRAYSWQEVQCLLVNPNLHWLVLAILLNLTSSEVLFFISHKLLHEHPKLMKFHVFHHCSEEASWNTNLLFHPVDLAIEFGGPFVSVVLNHFVLWKPYFEASKGTEVGSLLADVVLWGTYLIFQMWYACDHDEGLALWHQAKHHKYCDRLYAIYTPLLRGRAENNILREKMQEMGLLQAPRSESIVSLSTREII